ncbi:hypothetical protein [Salegentibacter salarius]|uniref:Uncharacterized protein n=1 Tax=Salegentibacter salarius TaxID=435906 RepID=A0A2N0TX16_9FLAO|nr:hypothetical protein [Salegentibacter salarius]OEY72788.1 hypothetical protein BHS39_11120 [Salegentibacter salarius]PKD19246.1 hypothetical protein APR40_11100 [Salegentibacter salarius]SLJ99802.1 hypothetical protein SAMN05660445_02270 [Salegentibacter salarius]
MKNKIKYSLIFSLVLYLLANLFIIIQEKYYEDNLKNYDLNENGFFEENERTKKQQIIQEIVAGDTARTLAPITTIPIIIIFGFLFWSTLKIVGRKKLT